MSKETFKLFMKNNPDLLNKINSGEMTFQKYYEIYEVYGDDTSVWNKYKEDTITISKTSSTPSWQEIVNMVKKVDLNTVKKGVSGLQKAIGLVQELGIGSTTTDSPKPYEERPIYKHLDD